MLTHSVNFSSCDDLLTFCLEYAFLESRVQLVLGLVAMFVLANEDHAFQ